RVAFREGQTVRVGDLLAEIDSRPYAAELAQAEGQLARDSAQLENARLNLERFRTLVAKGLVARQQVDDQASLAAQYQGAVASDRGAIQNARVSLDYCRITAPIDGRTGLRLVDVGNVVHAA